MEYREPTYNCVSVAYKVKGSRSLPAGGPSQESRPDVFGSILPGCPDALAGVNPRAWSGPTLGQYQRLLPGSFGSGRCVATILVRFSWQVVRSAQSTRLARPHGAHDRRIVFLDARFRPESCPVCLRGWTKERLRLSGWKTSNVVLPSRRSADRLRAQHLEDPRTATGTGTGASPPGRRGGAGRSVVLWL